MFTTNEYFDGKVKSIAFEAENGKATIGVMASGEYEFAASTIEHMTVTSGEMQVQLADSEEWFTYQPFETFIVEKDTSFKVKVAIDASYRCLYK